jgi:hypothetical protein
LPEDVFKDFIAEKTDRTRNAVLYRYLSQNNIVVQNVSGSGKFKAELQLYYFVFRWSTFLRSMQMYQARQKSSLLHVLNLRFALRSSLVG